MPRRLGGHRAKKLRRGMNVIATVSSDRARHSWALLGTVLGIIGAFQGIGAAGSAGIGPVMGGISEALVETAFGLLVAIPAVIAFNYLNARVAAMDTALGAFPRASCSTSSRIISADQHAVSSSALPSARRRANAEEATVGASSSGNEK